MNHTNLEPGCSGLPIAPSSADIHHPRHSMIVNHHLESPLLPTTLNIPDLEWLIVLFIILEELDIVVGIAEAVIVECGLKGVTVRVPLVLSQDCALFMLVGVQTEREGRVGLSFSPGVHHVRWMVGGKHHFLYFRTGNLHRKNFLNMFFLLLYFYTRVPHGTF